MVRSVSPIVLRFGLHTPLSQKSYPTSHKPFFATPHDTVTFGNNGSSHSPQEEPFSFPDPMPDKMRTLWDPFQQSLRAKNASEITDAYGYLREYLIDNGYMRDWMDDVPPTKMVVFLPREEEHPRDAQLPPLAYNLSDKDLTGLWLHDAWLQLAPHPNPLIEETLSFYGSTLDNAYLARTHFENKTSFRHVTMKGIDLSGTSFQDKALFRRTRMQQANLSGAYFNGNASFQDAVMEGANLSGTHFNNEADFSRAKMQGVDLRNITFENVTAISFANANLTGAIMDRSTYDMLKKADKLSEEQQQQLEPNLKE